MGMFYCQDCKSTRKNSQCPVSEKHKVYKYWWTFAPDDNHRQPYKVWYKPDGTIDRETAINE